MNKDEMIELAKQAGWQYAHGESGFEPLWAFANLVAAAEHERHTWDIHSCGPTCQKAACVATREAVIAEREACAKVCDGLADKDKLSNYYRVASNAIRARSNT